MTIYTWHKKKYRSLQEATIARMREQATIMERAQKKGMPFAQWLQIFAPKFPQIEEITL